MAPVVALPHASPLRLARRATTRTSFRAAQPRLAASTVSVTSQPAPGRRNQSGTRMPICAMCSSTARAPGGSTWATKTTFDTRRSDRERAGGSSCTGACDALRPSARAKRPGKCAGCQTPRRKAAAGTAPRMTRRMQAERARLRRVPERSSNITHSERRRHAARNVARSCGRRQGGRHRDDACGPR